MTGSLPGSWLFNNIILYLYSYTVKIPSMKKILKIVLISLLSLILVIFIGLYVAYYSFSVNDKGVEVVEENLAYFQESYEECRQAFLEEAANVINEYEQAELSHIQVPSQIDQELFIDMLYVPPMQDSGKLLVISSGIHGVEGFVGSAVQQMFMKEVLSTDLLSEMGVLLIHGMNPYGFKYNRRVTENNVDLNRGSDIDPGLFKNKNPGYSALYDMLNPEGEASTASLRNQFFYLIAIGKMMQESMSVLRQAVMQGQYEYPEGVYFGGTDFEPQIDSLTRILPGIFSPYETILEIDLHTGYGARGVLHLFPNPVDDPDQVKKTEFVFAGHSIDWGDSDDFYTLLGGFADSFLSKIKPDATYLYMPFEWGTLDSQKTFGSLHSIQNIIIENQGHNYGYKNSKQQERIVNNLLESYYPKSDAWRSEVLASGRAMLNLVITQYPEVN